MERRLEITTPERVLRRSGYQALQPPRPPPHAGVDLDRDRRPGVVWFRNPRPFPNAKVPPERQRGVPSAPKHGRPNKPMPPVFGTAVPPRGLSGAIRLMAYRYPDHKPRHWLLKMFGDRVDSWGYRLRRLAPFAVPLAMAALVVRMGRVARGRGRFERLRDMRLRPAELFQ